MIILQLELILSQNYNTDYSSTISQNNIFLNKYEGGGLSSFIH